MRSVEVSAKTRQDAIQKALDKLGAERHEVEVEILDEGSRGIFGFGARDVRVKVTAEGLPDLPPERPPRPERTERPPRPERGERPQRQDRPPRPDRPDKQGKPPSRPEKGRREEKREDRPARQDRPPRQERPAKSEKGARPDHAPKQQQKPPKPAKQTPRPPRPPRPPRSEKPREHAPAKPAVELPPISEEHREAAAKLLSEILAKMGVEASVTAQAADDGGARLDIQSADSAILIGHKGRNLQALQYLINRMIRMGDIPETTERIRVDVESYVDRRRQSLEEMAIQLANKAKETRRDVRLKPLSPQERRIIHLTLQDDPDVRTFSTGSSLMRSVVISPKNAVRPERGPKQRSRPPQRRGNRPHRSQTEEAGDEIEVQANTEVVAPEVEPVMPVVQVETASPVETPRESSPDTGGEQV